MWRLHVTGTKLPGVQPPKLTVELVPSTAWYTNVRSQVPKAEWDRLRFLVYDAAGRRCEVCGGRGPKWPVECHEVWDYDDTAKVQKLVRLIALCPACHSVKHIGRASVTGGGDVAVRHLAKVNGWSVEDAKRYVESAFEVWSRRSAHQWTLDLAGLKQYLTGA